MAALITPPRHEAEGVYAARGTLRFFLVVHMITLAESYGYNKIKPRDGHARRLLPQSWSMIGPIGLHRLFDTWLKPASRVEASPIPKVKWDSLAPLQRTLLLQLANRYHALEHGNTEMTVDELVAECGTVNQLLNAFSTFTPETMEFLSRSATTVLLAVDDVSTAFHLEIAPIRGHQPICTM